MAIPSSPPLMPEGLPSSPLLPAIAPFHRKRHFTEDDNLSSDPVFSEDASESDEQSGERRKRRYRGPWWAHTKHGNELRKPSKFADSGVWLASEASDDGFLLPTVHGAEQDDHSLHTEKAPASGNDVPTDVCRAQNLPSPHQLATQIVLDCVERSQESIDLTDMSLTHLPTEAVKPLRHIIRIRNMDEPNSDNFMPLTPELKIFLSNNQISALPDELWTLDNLTVLSLRNNKLSEIPGFIGQLGSLEELNIAGNSIHWLPWELLDLIRLRQGQVLRLMAHPNPLWLPVDASLLATYPPISFANPAEIMSRYTPREGSRVAGIKSGEYILSTMIGRVASTWLDRRRGRTDTSPNMAPVFGAATTIRYFDLNGEILRQQSDLPGALSEESWPADVDADPSLDVSPSNTPSLFELSAQCLRTQYPEHVGSLVDHPDLSDPVRRALQQLIRQRSSRLPSCSVCQRSYLFKRAEWVEYWHCNMSESSVPSQLLFVPFMRRACSWGCVTIAWKDRESAGSDTAHSE